MELSRVGIILGCVASGSSPGEIIEEFPDLTAEDISACLVVRARSFRLWRCSVADAVLCRSLCVPFAAGLLDDGKPTGTDLVGGPEAQQIGAVW